MKENEPEKLYIALNELTEDRRTFVLDHRVDYPICTEYTHTDVFIEKAAEWLMENVEKHISADGEYTVYYNEMFEDFKNYMKGE